MKRCTATTAKGNPCRAYAMHGRDLCSSHAKANKGAGAPIGNQNAQKHGFYRSVLTAEEIADLVTHAQNETIDDEIAITRVLLRRLMNQLQVGDSTIQTLNTIIQKRDIATAELLDILQTLQESTDQLKAIAPLVFTGTRTVANLMRHKKPNGGLADTINDVLDELASQFPIQL